MRATRFRCPLRARATAGALALVVALAAGCNTQRFPAPMRASGELPPGALLSDARGPQQVDIVRHADPVQLRRAGQAGFFPLNAYEKRERLSAGSWVYAGPGGRVEILWPERATSIFLFGPGVVVIGEPTRDEPTAIFRQVSAARVYLTPDDRLALPGGAILRGAETGTSGPFKLDLVRPEVVRIVNQSRVLACVGIRDTDLLLAPGQLVDVPILPGRSGRPFDDPRPRRGVDLDGFRVSGTGEFEMSRLPGGVRLRAVGESELDALGVRVRLGQGDEVGFAGLGAAELDRGELGPGGLGPGGLPGADANSSATPPGEELLPLVPAGDPGADSPF